MVELAAAGANESNETMSSKSGKLMEGMYRGLLEGAPDAMVVVNQMGDIVLLNLQAEKQFGYHRDELLGQKVTNIIPEGFAERLIADDLRSADEALEQQIGTGLELIALRKDGSKFPIEIMLSPLVSAEGILNITAIRDISGRKRLERMKDEFISSVSHELRTPLTSIAGSLRLLVALWSGKLPESATRLLAIAHTNSLRLVRLVNEILDIEKMEAGRAVFNCKRVDVATLIVQAVEGIRGFADSNNVRIRIEEGSSTGDVNADPDRLVQVLTNLLSNAIKFSPENAEVVVNVEKENETYRITVRDHGAGIPVDFKSRVFERFAQANAATPLRKSGTGLGLSIVRQIVDRLNGKVGFEDAPGGGALFYVELPAWDDPDNDQIDLEAHPDGKPMLALKTSFEPELSGRLRVLHVDDDRDMLGVLALALRGTADVVSVVSIEGARQALANERIDLVVLDIMLGEESGLDLMPELRDRSGGVIPVIVFSVRDASLPLDPPVQATLQKSEESLRRLVILVADCLARPRAPISKEVA